MHDQSGFTGEWEYKLSQRKTTYSAGKEQSHEENLQGLKCGCLTIFASIFLRIDGHPFGVEMFHLRHKRYGLRAVYAGFVAALKDLKLYVINVVPSNLGPSFMMIHLLSALKKMCSLVSVMAEVDIILRPQGTFIVRDDM
ncbi:putative S-adenosyl-L-methionine-dependent methyltransferase protein [Raphanus sativus]|nr:putative S-adenosyl-L-methionine-dependent methyltransferase protein [Raphanus sativus]